MSTQPEHEASETLIKEIKRNAELLEFYVSNSYRTSASVAVKKIVEAASKLEECNRANRDAPAPTRTADPDESPEMSRLKVIKFRLIANSQEYDSRNALLDLIDVMIEP